MNKTTFDKIYKNYLTEIAGLNFQCIKDQLGIEVVNDEADEFPAQTSLLFEKRAEKYLDMECLAMIAWSLYELLIKIAENSKGTLI